MEKKYTKIHALYDGIFVNPVQCMAVKQLFVTRHQPIGENAERYI